MRNLIALLLFLCLPAAAQPPQEALKLSKIEFEGLGRVSREDALAKLGLQVGQEATPEQIEEAAQRLQQSGLFLHLGYSVKGKTDAAVLTFKVEEQKWGVPVVFDNFIWFTDEELAAAVRQQVPTYDGTAPDGGGVTDEIARALRELLRSRKLGGEVEYMPSADTSGRNARHVFTVKNAPGLRVCTINFPGARTVTQEELVRKSAGLFDNDFSRLFVGDYVRSNLLPLYHERGMLRAAFAASDVKPAAPTDDCAQGLALTVYVDEGSVYVWERAEWSGQQALTAQELDAALAMKARDIASSTKIEKGLNAVRRAYGRKGYLGASVRFAQEFDDANRKVAYRFDIREGAQYRMGALTVTGLDERDTNNVRVRWRLLPGEVYDEGYLAEFLKKNLAEFLRDVVREGRQPPYKEAGVEVKPNHEKLTVDVLLKFK
jgi:outer membrane protein assembly factor BamA